MSTVERPADTFGAGVEHPVHGPTGWGSPIRDSDRIPANGRAASGPPAPYPEALPYRPTVREAMALLRIVDDGSEEGELIRIRRPRLIIGRAAGDGEVVIPHDISMSPCHAAIERLGDAGWRLSDLGSTGGTFVRVTAARLRDGSVFQVGRTRLRFQAVDLTEAWLLEERPERPALRHECHAPTTFVGRSGCGCGIGIDDPFVSPRHAAVRRTPRGWIIENTGINGLWLRIEGPVRLAAPSQFLCGEQRFVFMPCG